MVRPMNIYKIKYVVLAKSWPESEHETKHHCELTVAADDVESAIKRVREESKHQVVRITDAPYVAAVDLWPNAGADLQPPPNNLKP